MAIKQVAITLSATLLVGVVLLFPFTTKSELISFIVAFASSSLVVVASFKNYKNMVLKRLETLEDASEVEYQDAISKLEDPYNLYDDEEEKPQEVSKDQNKRDKKEIAKDTLITFAPIRILAYAIFTLAFFLLLKSEYFDLKFYVASLIIPNIVSAIFLVFFIKK